MASKNQTEEKPKKKLSAKERKRLKEVQRQEELETKTNLIAEGMYKRHDLDRKLQETTDRQRRYLEQVRGEREIERLSHQSEIWTKWWAHYTLRLNLALKEFVKHHQWDNIVTTSPLPHVDDEADINSFLSVWQEGEYEVPGDEDRRRDTDSDFRICSAAVRLINNILEAIDEVRQSRDTPSYTRISRERQRFHSRNLTNLYNQISATVNKLTANIMQYLDKYLDEGDEQALTLCKANEDIRYGLWCGNKLPRLRNVDFPPLGITISPKDGTHLPRQLNLMNSVAVRVLQFSFDPMSVREPDSVGLEYYALGGVLIVETMSVPQSVKHAKDWVLRMETALAHDVQTIPYPPVATDATGHQAPPIRVTFQVPPNVVVRHTAPVIGMWAPQYRCWQPEGTSDFSYDQATRRATFLTQHLTTLAVIQERGFDVPYEQWYMYPVSYECVVLAIEGRRRDEISDREVHIEIRGNKCRVLQPEEPELEYLRNDWYAPATLLRHLRNSGYNFILNDCDADYTPDILPKSWALEDKVYDDLALFCTVFEFASTRHNKLGEDSNMCLFRMSKQMHDEDEGLPLKVDLEDDDRWHTVRYEKDRCVLTQCRETDELPNLEELPGSETHLNTYMAMGAAFSRDKIDHRVDTADLLLQNAVKALLSLVRPVTWG